jgi:hypothetical protein
MERGAKHMTFSTRLSIALAAMAALLATPAAFADPWARPGDVALRHDVQLLADAGVIRSPVTTWPIPWGTLSADVAAYRNCVEAAESAATQADDDCPRVNLDPAAEAALARLQGRMDLLERLRDRLQPNARIAARTDDGPWLRTFEDTPRDDLEGRVGVSWLGERVAARVQVSYANDPREGDREWRGDGSYLAALFANQIVYAGALDRWWGPSHADSLLLSSNARPVSALGLERNVARPFETRWLSWLGPWNYSLVWGFLESGREVPNARLTAFRVSFRPTNNLEIGLSRAAQWCGQGRPCDFDVFTDLVLGRDNVGDDGITEENEPGNQLAAVDFRWRSPFMTQPWAIYGQGVAEDEAGGLPSRWFGQLGLEAWGAAGLGSWRGFVEFTNSLLYFYKDEPFYDTAYNHSIYESGYRYYGRTIGAGVDGDSQVLTAGLTWVTAGGPSWHLLLRAGTLNERGDGVGRDALHAVAPEETDILGGRLSYRRPLQYQGVRLGTLALGLGAQRAENTVRGEDETDLQAFLQWTWDYSGL